MTVAEMLTRMTAREYDDWRAFAAHEPIGDQRGDHQAGVIASAVINTRIDLKKSKALTPADFMPDFDKEPERPMTPRDLAAKEVEITRIDEWKAKARAAGKQA